MYKPLMSKLNHVTKIVFFFLMIPSQNKIEISVKGDTHVLLGVKELSGKYFYNDPSI